MSAALALLADSAIKASLLSLLASLAARFGRRSSPAFRHDIWLAALAGAVLLPVAALLFRLLASPAVAPMHELAMTVAPLLPSDGDGWVVETIDQIWSGDSSVLAGGWIGPALLALWLAGVLASMLGQGAAYAAAASVVRRAVPYPDIAAPIPVLLSPELSSPAVFGPFRPIILLPAQAPDWPSGRLRAVIAHEAAHAARRDCLLDLLVRLACALHWFNPLVTRAARALRAERELACDARVLAAGLDARDYAQTLIDIARAGSRPSPVAMLAMAHRPELERQIGVLLASERSRRIGGGSRLLPGLALLAFLPLAAMTAPSAGLLGPGSVQPADGPYSGLDDPMSERLPLPYEELAVRARAVPDEGTAATAVRALKAHLDRRPRGYGDLVRERAIWNSTQIENGRLFEPVSRHAADRDWRSRAYAAWALAAVGDSRATPLLMPMLRDPVWRVRAMAAAALESLDDPRATPAMAAALKDPAWQVRMSAAQYIVNRRDRALMPLLAPLRDDRHAAPRMITAALLGAR